jgi:hypothetical protein
VAELTRIIGLKVFLVVKSKKTFKKMLVFAILTKNNIKF